MASIVDFIAGGVDRTAFPAGASAFHKTASDWILTIEQRGAGAGRDFAWAYNLSDGIVSNAYSKATAARLRCVRGGAGEAPSAPAVAPPDQYTLVADGEVRDNYTGLVWQQGYSDATMAFDAAAPYCAGLTLGGHTWRLPSIAGRRSAGRALDQRDDVPRHPVRRAQQRLVLGLPSRPRQRHRRLGPQFR
jgi:hypothetical protein